MNEIIEEESTEKKVCKNCGSELEANVAFCSKCGEPTSPSQQAARQNNNQAPANYSDPTINIPPEYRPITMWGYFGYQILFMLPCIGLIMLLVFAFGGTQNINVRNFARSYFCVFIILAVLIAILMLVFGLTLGSAVATSQPTYNGL